MLNLNFQCVNISSHFIKFRNHRILGWFIDDLQLALYVCIFHSNFGRFLILRASFRVESSRSNNSLNWWVDSMTKWWRGLDLFWEVLIDFSQSRIGLSHSVFERGAKRTELFWFLCLFTFNEFLQIGFVVRLRIFTVFQLTTWNFANIFFLHLFDNFLSLYFQLFNILNGQMYLFFHGFLFSSYSFDLYFAISLYDTHWVKRSTIVIL